MVSTVSPQVVATQAHVARDFGYEAFSFDIADSSGIPVEDDIFDFLIGVFAYDESGHPVSIENSTLYTHSVGSPIDFYTADYSVAPGGALEFYRGQNVHFGFVWDRETVPERYLFRGCLFKTPFPILSRS